MTRGAARRRVLLVQRNLQPPGGGHGVAAWIAQALEGRHALTLLTWAPPDLAAIDRFYGTRLERSGIVVLSAPPLLRRAVASIPDPHHIQELSFLLRLGRRVQGRFDVLVTAENEVDFGRRGIQYVHFPALHEAHRRRAPPDAGLAERVRALARYQWRPWRLVSGYSVERMKRNVTLTNSEWTAERIREIYGIEATVVYPPVVGRFPNVPWEDKEDGFVVVGRWVEGKNLERAIEILSRVRRAGADAHLHLVGTPGTGPAERAYHPRLMREVARHDWIHVDEDLPRAELVARIARHRYGLHAMVDEHFGMAVAEMVEAGCIPFVPDGGGQREIVGHDPRLVYGSVPDAVEKILGVVRDPARQRELLGGLGALRSRFSADAFVGRIRDVVERFPDV